MNKDLKKSLRAMFKKFAKNFV